MDKSEIEYAISQYQTPFYIFDTDILANQINKMRTALGTDVEMCYAMKANPFVIKEMQDIVDYFEVCSHGEFSICELADIDVNKIVMSGVYKNFTDIETMIYEYGNQIIYTIESLSQWKNIADFTLEHQRHVRVLLRLTTGNQFGMDETVIREIIANRNKNPYIDIEGIQFFSGTQKKSTAKFEKELEMLDNLCSDLQKQYAFNIKKIEYGPGLPICYFEDNNVEDLMLDLLAKQIKKLNFKGKITLEIGRFIAASCGFYVTSVVDVKVNNNENFCFVDGGIHHINYLGQIMGMKKPSIIHLDEKRGETKEWTVCGSLCTVNDVLVKQYPFVDISQGDTLIFKKVGAYSVTEGISLFLSHELPQVLLYSEKCKFRLARSNYPTYILNY